MTAAQRRQAILKILHENSNPISATAIAKQLSVSRQIIVGDVALLRAKGSSIYATPRGYILDMSDKNIKTYTIACKHNESLTEQELNVCVDNGCKVLDVIVEHPIYGQLTGELQISSRYDIKQFLDKVSQNKAHSLCELTNDIHLHTLICPDKETYERVCHELNALGILINHCYYYPSLLQHFKAQSFIV